MSKIIPRDKGFKQNPFKMPKVKPPCLVKQDQSPAALQKPNFLINRI